MLYLTHLFAHSETLDRARRWLIHAGISPDRMQLHHQGVPRMAIEAEPSEVQSIEMIIRIAEMNDPEGLPGFWDLARLHPAGPDAGEGTTNPSAATSPDSFKLAWHPIDAPLDEGLRREVESQKAYRDLRP